MSLKSENSRVDLTVAKEVIILSKGSEACPSCGSQLLPGSDFCSTCGAKLADYPSKVTPKGKLTEEEPIVPVSRISMIFSVLRHPIEGMKLVVRQEDIMAPFIILLIAGLIEGIASGLSILLTMDQVIQWTSDIINSMGFNLAELTPGFDFIAYMYFILVLTAGLIVLITPVLTLITWAVSFLLLFILIIIFGNFQNPRSKKLLSIVGYGSIPLLFYAIVNTVVNLLSNLISLAIPSVGITNFGFLLFLVTAGSLGLGFIIAVIFKGWSAFLVYRGIEAMGVEDNTALIALLYAGAIIIVPILMGIG